MSCRYASKISLCLPVFTLCCHSDEALLRLRWLELSPNSVSHNPLSICSPAACPPTPSPQTCECLVSLNGGKWEYKSVIWSPSVEGPTLFFFFFLIVPASSQLWIFRCFSIFFITGYRRRESLGLPPNKNSYSRKCASITCLYFSISGNKTYKLFFDDLTHFNFPILKLMPGLTASRECHGSSMEEPTAGL